MAGVQTPETHKIRTTMQPEKEIEVSHEEFVDLTRQGVVYDGAATTAEGARRAVAAKQAAVAAGTQED